MKNFQLFFRVAETDNIGRRILKILKEKKIKPTPFEDGIDISRGYIKRAAENNTGLGSEIVEKILLKFPDIDAYWLITGIYLSRNTDENSTPVQPLTEIEEKIKAAQNAALVIHLTQENKNLWDVLKKERGGGKGKTRISDN